MHQTKQQSSPKVKTRAQWDSARDLTVRTDRTKPLTSAPSGPNICRKLPMNSRDFSSHFWMRSMLFSSTFWTNSLLFSSTSRTFFFTLSTRSCRLYFFSWWVCREAQWSDTRHRVSVHLVDRGWTTYVDEADVELFGCVSSLQVASGVQVVVADDARDNVGGGDALGSLGRSKHPWGRHSNTGGLYIYFAFLPTIYSDLFCVGGTLQWQVRFVDLASTATLTGFLDVFVHVIASCWGVWDVIVRHKINLETSLEQTSSDFESSESLLAHVNIQPYWKINVC